MRRISLVLSMLSVGIAFSAVMLAIGTSRAFASPYPNAYCVPTPAPGYLTACACEGNAGNAAHVFACDKSWEFGQLATLYYCISGGTASCALGGTDCGLKRDCGTPGQCNNPYRQCAATGLPCDAVTETGCINIVP
jgi:hypothetical protein